MKFKIKLILPKKFERYNCGLDPRFQGGIAVEIDGVNITKLKNSKKPCVFSDYVLLMIEDWLNKLPDIVKGKECRCDLFDNPWTFIFKPVGGDTEISFFNYGSYGNVSTNEINSELEGEGKPHRVPTGIFVEEVIQVAKDLIATLKKSDSNLINIDWFKETAQKLQEMEKLWIETKKIWRINR